jgi:hypothetical protein
MQAMGANLAETSRGAPPFDCDGGPGGICGRPLRRFAARLFGDHMTTFDDRERGFEKRFALDQEQEFKASARRNRALGEWAAGLMSLTEKHVAEYAQAVVKSDFEQPGEDDVLRKVFEDLKGAGVQISEGEVRMKMAELLAQARESVREGK